MSARTEIHWLKSNRPPFRLSAEQRAVLDAAGSDDVRTMHLQNWHQAYCWEHRQILGVSGSLDPATFTRRWQADFGDLFAAWAQATQAQEKAA